jgi:hypothetical protein
MSIDVVGEPYIAKRRRSRARAEKSARAAPPKLACSQVLTP